MIATMTEPTNRTRITARRTSPKRMFWRLSSGSTGCYPSTAGSTAMATKSSARYASE